MIMSQLSYRICQKLSHAFTQASCNSPSRCLQTSATCCKAKAGRHTVSKKLNKPLTYDQAFKPDQIGVKKGWLSVHTGNLHGEKNASARIYEDQFIRRFMDGTFHRLIATDLVIKRRFNIIEVIAFVQTPTKADKIFVLKEYSERILSAFFKCNVKLFIYHVDKANMQYKFI